MNTTDSENPFAAPRARLEDYSGKTGNLLAEPRVVRAGEAMEWLRTGWEMFQEAPGAWVVIVLVYFLILMVVGMIPIIGMLNVLLSPVFAAGIIMACEAQHNGELPRVTDLFQGFQRNTWNLMLIGILYLVGVLLIAAVLGGGTAAMLPFFIAGGEPTAPAVGAVILVVATGMLLVVPLGLTMWWSPALVTVHDIASFDAMKRSLAACLRNWRALIVWTLLMLVICIIAVIPVGLGLLIAGPVLAISWWAGYRAIFLD